MPGIQVRGGRIHNVGHSSYLTILSGYSATSYGSHQRRPVTNGNNFDVSPGSHGRDQIKIDLGQHVDTLEEQRANMTPSDVNPFSTQVRKINRDLQ